MKKFLLILVLLLVAAFNIGCDSTVDVVEASAYERLHEALLELEKMIIGDDG